MPPELEDEVVEGADAPETATAEVDPSGILGMSDEDFLNMPIPGATLPAAEPEAEPAAAPAASEAAASGDVPAAEATPTPAAETPTETPAAAPVEGEVPAAEAPPEIDYKAAYERLMSPLKANGKTIDLRDPDELLSLAQMGANYTRKMQELAPHRKLLAMVQNAGLNEDQLSFLIDLDKKNPEAVKKLIKDAGIDPMEIDTATEPAYLAGNHRVSDEEVDFKSALDELSSTPDGVETLKYVDGWDQASKQAMWGSPEILAIIHDQRATGVYGRIATEVDRQKTLGKIPVSTPFLKAYQEVGDRMKAAGAFNDLVAPAGGQPPAPAAAPAPAPVPVATTVVTPKPAVTADDRASAASVTRSTPTAAKEVINPLAMSDEAFLEHLNKFTGRL